MKINKAGMTLIKNWEGLYLHSYRDCIGVWTIGYGITSADKSITGVTIKGGMKISKETANKWLEDSLNKKYAPKVEKYQSKYNFNENQFAALVSFAFNVGSIDGLTANGTRSIDEIKKMILKYNKAGGRTIKGLTDRRKDELRLFNKPVATPERLLQDLAYYHKYIKEHPNKFINEYDSTITTFAKAKAKAKNVGITCVVPLRWALADMKIVGAHGKSLISAPNGSFKDYYAGDVVKYFKRITSGGPVGLTVSEAYAKGLLKPGDIVSYSGHTHTSVYKEKTNFYEGGGSCVVDGHYPKGILLDYSKNGYKTAKIKEVLRWKTTEKKVAPAPTPTPVKTGNYPYKIPEFAPNTASYSYGDGYRTLKKYNDQIKLIQRALNWSIGTKLELDGKYGINTKKAVIKYQKKYGLTQDGKWGKQCNNKLKTIRK